MIGQLLQSTGLRLAGVPVSLLLLLACAPATGAPPPGAGARAPAAGPEAVGDFYRGKTVTVVVGFAAGGGFDTTARLVARHLAKHMPGNPTVVVENMEGAGSLIATNHLYNVAKPDGLTIGVFNELQVLNQLTGAEGVQFDGRKFGWVGNAQRTTVACTVRADSPYTTAQDLSRRDLPPLVLGGTGPGADTHDFPKVLIGALGANIKLVLGYTGTGPIRLAVESREVEGMCWAYESVLATAQNWLETNFINVFIYQSRARDQRIEQRFPNARRAEDLTDDAGAKSLLRATTAPGAMAKPFAAPPGVPPDRLKALQDAFAATVKDPAFLAEAEQARLDIDPNPGPETQRIVNEILDLAPDLARRLGEIRK